MKFTLTIILGNDAMQSPDDVAYALGRLQAMFVDTTDSFEELSVGDRSGRIRDLNGNTVGQWEVR
jgi:hypothetical protein